MSLSADGAWPRQVRGCTAARAWAARAAAADACVKLMLQLLLLRCWTEREEREGAACKGVLCCHETGLCEGGSS
jgi:hypothetical protein